MTYEEMYALACKNLAPQDYSEHCSAGYVSAVIEGANGKYYTGVNIDLACGLGYCAERNAAGSMVTDGERVVRRIVCVDRRQGLMTPCGSCRPMRRRCRKKRLPFRRSSPNTTTPAPKRF